MGVYIKGMEMPENCYKCPVRNQGFCGDGMKCGKTGSVLSWYDGNRKRMDNCPLIPVPKHGRLIEKNAVFELIWSFPDVDRQLPVKFMKELYELPTIIEAEEE